MVAKMGIIETQGSFPDKSIYTPEYKGQALNMQCIHCKNEFRQDSAQTITISNNGIRLIIFFCPYCNKTMNGEEKIVTGE